MKTQETVRTVCAIGDTHGHLQLALCMAARWQRELGFRFEAVLLCGDVGTFTEDSQLDSTTRRHGKRNPCELEFLNQWSVSPQPGYLAKIFAPVAEGGLGLECPVLMTHGNHEGFSFLASLVGGDIPRLPVPVSELPHVDKGNFLQYLPNGWKCRTSSGLVIGALGGIEKDQRPAGYHDMAYIDDHAVECLVSGTPFDILITHQGPASTQTESKGSSTLQLLLDLPKEEIARVWFHGHSVVDPEIRFAGTNGKMVIVPLRDAAFPGKGLTPDDPGDMAMCWAAINDEIHVERKRPDFWREYRRNKWKRMENGQLVCPDLAGMI